MPRPRALDDCKQREICALVATGCSLATAARYVGCNSVTIRRESLRSPEFYDQLRQAQFACQVGPLRAVRRAAESHWRAAAWLLERTDPEQFARHNPDHITPDLIEQFVAAITDIIAKEIDDADTLHRVTQALAALDRQLQRRTRAATRPLIGPRRRLHHQPAPRPFPDESPHAADDCDEIVTTPDKT